MALVATASWWVAIVELVPAADRPYAGGSQTISVLELIFGYNGFGRLTGNEPGSIGGPVGDGPDGGDSAFGGGGITQLFNPSWGGQIAWLLPAALLFFAALVWLSRRAPRGDRLRSSALLWGGWLLVTAAVLSFGQGIIHSYYTVTLAPAIGALVGHGRRPVHRPRCAVAAGRAVDLGALRPGHRYPAGRSSRVVRGPKRQVISRCYNTLLRGILRTRFSDAQCGFKAIRADVAAALLPLAALRSQLGRAPLKPLVARVPSAPQPPCATSAAQPAPG